MTWWCSQNLHAMSHLQKIWRVLCDCFETYSAAERDAIVQFMCWGKVGGDSSLYLNLKDPRKPSPGHNYRWKNGYWVMNIESRYVERGRGRDMFI